MSFGNAIKSVFGSIKKYVSTMWREIGGYTARFSSFGTDMYANDVVRACVRTLAKHTSKASPSVIRDGKEVDKRLQDLLEYRPNMYMNGKDFLQKIRTLYELYNTVFIYINRDDAGRCVGLYPIPECGGEAVDVDGRLFIRFNLPIGETLVASWEDLAVLRKDYNKSDIWGDENTPILKSLDLLSTTSQGIENAIKSTANLRGIIKSTKAMLSDDDVKAIQERFIASYMTMTNTSGVAALDATQEYVPLEMQPVLANYKSIEELRNNIHRYFGTNDDIVMSKADPDQMDAFYDAEIEPFLLALSLELTYKIFTNKQRAMNTRIVYAADRLSFMSTKNKLLLVQLVDRGAMTPNAWAAVFNLPPQPGGDIPRRWQDPKNEGGNSNADKNGQGIQGNEPADPDSGKTD